MHTRLNTQGHEYDKFIAESHSSGLTKGNENDSPFRIKTTSIGNKDKKKTKDLLSEAMKIQQLKEESIINLCMDVSIEKAGRKKFVSVGDNALKSAPKQNAMTQQYQDSIT